MILLLPLYDIWVIRVSRYELNVLLLKYRVSWINGSVY